MSEVRKKNWKLCWPFALDGNHSKPEEETCTLPHLHVSKFRWWRCQNCLQEMGAEGNTYNCGNGPNYCSSTRYKSSGTRSHGSSLGDAAIQQSDLEQVPNHNIVDGRKVDATVVADLNVKDCCPSPHNDKNGKKSFTKTPFIGIGQSNFILLECLLHYVQCIFLNSCVSPGHESGPEDEMNLEIPVSAGTATGVTSELITGRHHTIDIGKLLSITNQLPE